MTEPTLLVILIMVFLFGTVACVWFALDEFAGSWRFFWIILGTACAIITGTFFSIFFSGL